MNSTIRSSLVLFLLLIVLINADIVPLDTEYDVQCQSLHCNTSTEICRLNPECDGSQNDLSLKCVYCALKNQSTYFSRQLPLAPRLLAKSGEPKLNTQNGNLKSNSTSKGSSYDEYYEYDDDDALDKNESVDADDYTNEYVESYDPIMNRSQTIRKSGICPKVVQTNVKCGAEKLIQPDCRFDTDCPGELKCCEAPCGKRVCKSPIKTKVSVCPTSFQCTLNCPLGYRTDSNGCLKCECQSCPSMEQCNKNCPSGYLKDLFGCDVCECNDRCPPFFCTIICPSGVGFAQSENGCPLCQCAISRSKPIEHTSSCQVYSDPEPVADVPIDNTDCQSDLETNCDLQCSSGNYLLDARGCPTCACASNEGRQLTSCPEIKCRANCGDSGYQLDENGCQTCKCAKKENVQCSGVMCRMFCQNGFKRDENGCQYCACNESPQACPLLECSRVCKNGFRKDYSGCQTCDCNYEQEKPKDNCAPVECDLQCKYGFQRDQSACKMCACNRCPTRTCRMFCMYGFRRNEDGCDICECDWTPVSEKIQCSERIPCPDQRVCNMQLRLCEKVDPDSVNWFLYDFEIQSDIFNDHMFVQTFKSGLINNIAMKYGLEPAQISVSSVEQHGLTSFQIMPFYAENIEDFQTKMDQIDADLNSHDFRSVLPGVVQVIDNNDRTRQNKSTFGVFFGKLMHFVRMSTRSLIFMLIFLLIATGFIVFIMRFNACRRRFKHSNRSDSKSPIYDSTYHPAPTEDELYHAIKTDDGATYVAVDTNEKNLSKNKQVYV
ncbi:unnamed protein product [Rotaria magnacalcarata]